MTEISFLNVGQGDSIFIESGKQIGIVDCNLINNTNPILNKIKSLDLESIEFIILSHPHEDHFSGLEQVFLHCEEKGILIKRFYHTFDNTKQFLEAVTLRQSTINGLVQLISIAIRLCENMIIQRWGKVDSLTEAVTIGQCEFSFLSPSQKEYNYFIRSNYSVDNARIEFKNNANILSTIIKIEDKFRLGILTSDAESQTLNGLSRKIAQIKKEAVFGQVPHHGSRNNHSTAFWNNFIPKSYSGPEPVAVISVGADNSYGHPDEDVIKYFDKRGFNIKATNEVNGYLKYFYNSELDDLSYLLDHVSSRVASSFKAQDVLVNF